MEYEEERELEKGVDEGGWIEYWIRVVNFIGNQKKMVLTSINYP